MMQFTELESEWSCTYAGMIETFARRGVFDEETQKNDLNIVREVLKVTKEAHPRLPFSVAEKPKSELTQVSWKS